MSVRKNSYQIEYEHILTPYERTEREKGILIRDHFQIASRHKASHLYFSVSSKINEVL